MTRYVLMLFLCGSLAAQTFVHVPDSNAASGTCNVIPFGASSTFASGYTYLGRIPAGFMNASNPYVLDVAFAACNTGIWAASDVEIAMGHLPSSLPCPFSFPDPSSGTTGSFLDLTVIQAGGPFGFSAVQDTWSDLGFAHHGGTGFTWNGVNDVGFFITFQNATVTGFSGDFHRTGTEPTRTYASGFNAGSSTTCNANSGLKMRLRVGPARQVGDANRDYVVNGRGSGFGSFVHSDLPTGTLMNNSYRTQDPLSPVIWAVAPGGTLGWLITGTNVVDIGPGGLSFLADGSAPGGINPYFSTDMSGVFNLSLTVPPAASGTSYLAMAHLAGSSPDGFWVSQTHKVDFCNLAPIAGPSTDDGFVNHSFTGLGSFTFYGTAYTDMWVNSNGNITFTSGDSDFTESASEMLAQEPRIAPGWDDLSPNQAGSVSIRESSTEVSATWRGVPHFSSGGSQTMCATLDKVNGTILFSYGTNTAWNGTIASSAVLVGISPGSSLGSQDALDLNGPPALATAANNAIFQHFVVGPPYDLDNQTVLLAPDVSGVVYGVH